MIVPRVFKSRQRKRKNISIVLSSQKDLRFKPDALFVFQLQSTTIELIIDKCYCRGLQLKNKKVGTIVVGGSPVDSIQYELIDKQFDCMAKYLSWNLLFQKSYYATAKDELSKNQDAMKELEDIGKEL